MEADTAGQSDPVLKLLRKPDVFRGGADDSAAWEQWSFTFKVWLGAADAPYLNELAQIEANLDRARGDFSGGTDEQQRRAYRLYALLCTFVEGPGSLILKSQMATQNGFECWRLLMRHFAPRSRQKQVGLVSALMSLKEHKNVRELLYTIEEIRASYRTASGQDLSDELLVTTLVRCTPGRLRTHIQLQLTPDTTYDRLKLTLMGFEEATEDYKFKGIMLPTSSALEGPSPMDIDRLQEQQKGGGKKGKGKGKDQKGKGKDHKGKGKGKKGSDGTKGKGKGEKGPNNTQKLDANQCKYCHSYGHWEKDCRKKAADMRQVTTAGQPSSSSGTSTAQYSASSGAVSRIQCFDLTDVSMLGHGNIFMVQNHGEDSMDSLDWYLSQENDERAVEVETLDVGTAELFDMTVADHEDEFHVRVFQDEPTRFGQIILDSGADFCMVPHEFGKLGCRSNMARPILRDAQGAQIHIADMRDLKLITQDTTGQNVCIKGTFAVGPIKSPLLSLGILLKQGWNLQSSSGNVCLTQKGVCIPIDMCKNSLAINAEIHRVQEDVRCIFAVVGAAVKLTDEMQKKLVGRPGTWKVLAGGIPGICYENCQAFQDARDMWEPQYFPARATLVEQNGWWQLKENISDYVNSPDCAAQFGQTYSRAITLLAAQCFPDEFFQNDDELQHDEADGQLGPQPVVAVAKPRVDVLETAKIKAGDLEVTEKSSNRELRDACRVWSLPTSGDKRKLWRRLLAHSLVVYNESALEVAEKLYSEQGREAITLRKPAHVSFEDLAKHELTHHPRLSSCEACVVPKAGRTIAQRWKQSQKGAQIVMEVWYFPWTTVSGVIANFLLFMILSMVVFWAFLFARRDPKVCGT